MRGKKRQKRAVFCRVCASAYPRGGGGGGGRAGTGRGMCNAGTGAPCLAAVCVACYVTGLACRGVEQHQGRKVSHGSSCCHILPSKQLPPSATCFVRRTCTRSVRSKPVLSGLAAETCLDLVLPVQLRRTCLSTADPSSRPCCHQKNETSKQTNAPNKHKKK